MRKARTLGFLLVAVCLMAMVVAGVGCENLEGQQAGKPDAALSMMKQMPGDAEMFVYYEFAQLRDDEDLSDLFEDVGGDFDSASNLGLDLAAVETVAMAGDTVVMTGEFDGDQLTAGLGGMGFTQSEHSGVNVWSLNMYGYAYAIALMNGQLIMGSGEGVEGIIDAAKGNGDSLYDNADVRGVVERLSDGLMVMVTAGSFDEEQDWAGLKLSAMSAAKKNGTTAELRAVWLFESAAKAEAAMDDIEAFVEEEGDVTLIDLVRDGAYVEATAEQDFAGLFGDDEEA